MTTAPREDTVDAALSMPTPGKLGALAAPITYDAVKRALERMWEKELTIKELFGMDSAFKDGGMGTWRDLPRQTINVPLDSIRPTQDTVHKATVLRYQREGVDPQNLPELVRAPDGSGYYVVDGHHRIVAQVAGNPRSVQADLIGEYTSLTPKGK